MLSTTTTQATTAKKPAAEDSKLGGFYTTREADEEYKIKGMQDAPADGDNDKDGDQADGKGG